MTKDKQICVKVLLPALIETKEQEEMTERCKKSLISFDYCVKLEVDKKRYPDAVAGVWNAFFDKWRGKEYDYLLVTANDTIADPLAIDFMVKCALDNPDAGMITGKVERDLEKFKKDFGQRKYTQNLTVGAIDPACFLIPKGVIEKVGRLDPKFPREFVERDWIWRLKLAGYRVIQPDVVTWYHPPYAGTIGNDFDRLKRALARYVIKWGGDANQEKYQFPYNEVSLDFTFTGDYQQ